MTIQERDELIRTLKEAAENKSKWTPAVVISLISAVFGGIAMCISAWNNHKIDKVDDKAVAQVQKTDEAALKVDEAKKAIEARDEKVDKATAKIDRIEKTVDKTENAVAKGVGDSLKSSWTYLQRIADETQYPPDVEAAKVAKKAYDDFVKKYGEGK